MQPIKTSLTYLSQLFYLYASLDYQEAISEDIVTFVELHVN